MRTVTELAALVASGAVRVPQGLEHYVSDRRQLLDQVFTILGLEDVSGMLPDVLKVNYRYIMLMLGIINTEREGGGVVEHLSTVITLVPWGCNICNNFRS